MNQLPVEQIDNSKIQNSSLFKIFESQNEEVLDQQIAALRRPEFNLLIKKITLILIGRVSGLLSEKAVEIVSDPLFVKSLFDMNPNIDRLMTILKFAMDDRVLKTEEELIRNGIISYDDLRSKYNNFVSKNNEDLLTKVEVAESERDYLNIHVKDLEGFLKEDKSIIESLSEENISLEKKVAFLNEDNEILTRINKELGIELSQLESSRVTQDPFVEEFEDSCDMVKDQNEGLNDRVSILLERIRVLNSRESDYMKNIDNLVADNKYLMEKLENLERLKNNTSHSSNEVYLNSPKNSDGKLTHHEWGTPKLLSQPLNGFPMTSPLNISPLSTNSAFPQSVNYSPENIQSHNNSNIGFH